MNSVTWPQPRGDALHGEFYRHCAAHELRFQRCLACARWRHMPRNYCAHCGSGDWEWAQSSGQGIVRSWTVCHRAFHPGVVGDLPYVVALVEFEPGVRLIARLDHIDADAVRLDLPVDVWFDEIAPGIVLPRVRPREAA